MLLRGARDAGNDEARQELRQAAEVLAGTLETLPETGTLDEIRGHEGAAAAHYFEVFGKLITTPTEEFAFTLRTRRPPRDRVNALLSFLYALVTHDCASAVQGVGLDPQLGFLHAVRPGRPAAALDLTEEFRAGFADRLALTLINRHQLHPEHFTVREEGGGSVLLNDEGRKIVLVAYQKRKEEQHKHHILQEDVPVGLLPHLQARLLARHLRGELDYYEPLLWL